MNLPVLGLGVFGLLTSSGDLWGESRYGWRRGTGAAAWRIGFGAVLLFRFLTSEVFVGRRDVGGGGGTAGYLRLF